MRLIFGRNQDHKKNQREGTSLGIGNVHHAALKIIPTIRIVEVRAIWVARRPSPRTSCQRNQKAKISGKWGAGSREKVSLRSQSASVAQKSSSRNQEEAATAAKLHLYQEVLIFSRDGLKT